MSILLKALKQAEADRAGARLAKQAGLADGAHGRADVRAAAGEDPDCDIPTAPQTQTATADTAPTASTKAMQTYGGLWITLALAVVSATGFGYWIKGMSAVKLGPLPPPSVTIQASAPATLSMAAPGTIPAVLPMHEAGPLVLQLDRHVDTLGARTP